ETVEWTRVAVEWDLRDGEPVVRARLQVFVPGEDDGVGERPAHAPGQEDVVVPEHVREPDEASAVQAVPVVAAYLRTDGGSADHLRTEADPVVLDLEVRGVRERVIGAV